jgi:hypothetical protein
LPPHSPFVLTSTLPYSIIAGKGILTSAIATGVLGFLTTLLFLFCIPDLDTFFALDAPQPFVQLYALALGKGPSVFMTIIAVIGLIMVSARVFYTLYITMVALISNLSSRILEYQYSRGGLFAAPLRRRARRRAPALALDRTRGRQSTAEERGDGHVRLCGRPALLHHTQPGRLHVAHIGGRRADHSRVRAHRGAALHVHAARVQDVAFLPRTLGEADVPRDRAVQPARLCGEPYPFYNVYAFLQSRFRYFI